MASVIRVKRRRNENPAEALVLSHKRSRLDTAGASRSSRPDSDSGDGIDTTSQIDSFLEFAGTISISSSKVNLNRHRI